jgi:hypothetical protein
VALPVVEESRFLSPGDMAHSLWISQDSQGDRGYRTNIAVVFPDPSGGSATVTLYDAAGTKQGQQEFSLDAAGLQQLGAGTMVAGGLAMGRAEIQVTGGRAAGYAVVVDNVTGDGSLFPFEALPGGRQDVVVNGVSRAGGTLGTFWRTDARLYNPSSRDASVIVRFHAAGESNASPQATTVTVPAGRILEVVDALGTLLNLPVGSSGALRFQSETPVAILCRTSNLDPTGAKPGTFGAQQQAVPLMSYLMSADAGAVVTGVKQNGEYRTNVGFAAGKEGAAYALTLRSPEGVVVGAETGSLGSFGWAQPNVGSLFPGTSIPDDAQLTVKVMAGSLDVYDSSIDAGSGDPVISRIAQLPADVPSLASIGPAGGSIRSSDGRLTLKIPAGALSANTALSIGSAANGAPQGAGQGYTVTPGGLILAKPALLVLGYDSRDTAGSAPGSLGLAFQSGGKWYVATGGSADTAERTVTVPVPSMPPALPGRAATEGPPKILDAPLDVSPFSALLMLPKKAAVVQGKKIAFRIWMTGPSSSEAVLTVPAPQLPPAFTPPGGTYLWYANGVLHGNGREGTLAEAGPGSEYSAPSCGPAGNPVRVSVRVVDPADPYAPHRFPQSIVRVVPPLWKVRWENGAVGECTAKVWGPTYSSTATGYIAVTEGLEAVYNPLLDERPTESSRDVERCGTCTMTLTGFDPASIESVTGGFDVDLDAMDLALNLRTTGYPGWTTRCDGLPAKDVPRGAGASFAWPDVAVPVRSSGVDEDLSFSSGGTQAILKLTIRPELNRCP